MGQVDWVGGGAEGRAFEDSPNRRPSVAEEKASLALTLGGLITKAPPFLASAGIIETRQFVAALEAARKIAGKKNASTQELRSAITNMQAWQR